MIIVSPRIPKNIVQNSVRNMKRFTVQSPENPAGVNRPSPLIVRIVLKSATAGTVVGEARRHDGN